MRAVKAYFTVEAALIMPIVLGCYLAVMTLMCFMYERCVFEQNACRILVRTEYLRGAAEADPSSGEFTAEECCRRTLEDMKEEERSSYLFAKRVWAGLNIRGERAAVERGMEYHVLGKWEHFFDAKVFCVDPADYIRTVKMIEKGVLE